MLLAVASRKRGDRTYAASDGCAGEPRNESGAERRRIPVRRPASASHSTYGECTSGPHSAPQPERSSARSPVSSAERKCGCSAAREEMRKPRRASRRGARGDQSGGGRGSDCDSASSKSSEVHARAMRTAMRRGLGPYSAMRSANRGGWPSCGAVTAAWRVPSVRGGKGEPGGTWSPGGRGRAAKSRRSRTMRAARCSATRPMSRTMKPHASRTHCLLASHRSADSPGSAVPMRCANLRTSPTAIRASGMIAATLPSFISARGTMPRAAKAARFAGARGSKFGAETQLSIRASSSASMAEAARPSRPAESPGST
ncbi:hypothetical protein DFJ74DRAFT_681984 [Hyaloraphidium curvatum]|nr:hypothetical protein DFJ74DRAFT_681984 [Hyaloraphidium curvatum]